MVKHEMAKSTALSMMHRALDLLDEAGEAVPAVHLQLAIDKLTKAPVPRTIEEVEAQILASHPLPTSANAEKARRPGGAAGDQPCRICPG